ncbi:MAG: hypothetical protein LAN71_17200 [Acidobacteriia bacterium]|nr:hypothetical protein [Terriglobia bacterium]
MKDEKEKLKDILEHVENIMKIFASDAPDVEFVKNMGRKPTKEEQDLLDSIRANYMAKLEELKGEILRRM